MREKLLQVINKFKEWIRKIKTAVSQALCKHKETELMEKTPTSGTRFYNIRGQKVYRVCKKCGKVVGEYFLEYEGPGYK